MSRAMGNYGLAVDAGPVEDEPASSGPPERGWLRTSPGSALEG